MQNRFVMQEKLASLGALTAGIAHEIKNPLNFVNNFAALSIERTEELREELEKSEKPVGGEVAEMLDDLAGNAQKIHHRRHRRKLRCGGWHTPDRRTGNQPRGVELGE